MVFLLICLTNHYWKSKIDLGTTKDFADTLKNFVEVLAIVVGGGWALFRFSKGREYQESLIPIISGKLTVINDNNFLVVDTEIKNVGHSKIDFLDKASTIKVFRYIPPEGEQFIQVPLEQIAQFDPLRDDDRYIEPNEVIKQTKFVFVPGSIDFGLRLELVIISSHERRYTWQGSCIVEKSIVQKRGSGDTILAGEEA